MNNFAPHFQAQNYFLKKVKFFLACINFCYTFVLTKEQKIFEFNKKLNFIKIIASRGRMQFVS